MRVRQNKPIMNASSPPSACATSLSSGTPVVVDIDLGERSYPIWIGRELLGQASAFAGLPKPTAVAIVTNATVAPLYAARIQANLQQLAWKSFTIVLPDGEAHKDWTTLNQIFDELLAQACDRKTLLVALGGGVIGDMTGFAAACFMRGVPFVQIPTTLLAQVDSSVGGKTAINHPRGKNMIGAFYQPLRVLADIDTLLTLPERELQAGLAEVIKYGPIADMAFFEWLEANMEALRARDPQALAHAIKRSCEIKAEVVGQDEKESGLRAILNFGHTFGHAIEAGMGYGVWLHGEAIAAGMVMAIELSHALGLVEATLVERLRQLLARAGLPSHGPLLAADPVASAQRYWALMQHDKKTEAGEIRFVVITQPGQAAMRAVPESLVHQVLLQCCPVPSP